MTDYQKMYTTLFNAVTDALKKMEVQNYARLLFTVTSRSLSTKD